MVKTKKGSGTKKQEVESQIMNWLVPELFFILSSFKLIVRSPISPPVHHPLFFHFVFSFIVVIINLRKKIIRYH